MFVERSWHAIKYEEVYCGPTKASVMRRSIGCYLRFYNDGRPHATKLAQTLNSLINRGIIVSPTPVHSYLDKALGWACSRFRDCYRFCALP